jgi:hypothetical protein
MLRVVALADDWRAVEAGLPERWDDARVRVTIRDDASCDRAAALLGPAAPGRRGKEISLSVSRSGGGTSPYLVQRLLRRLDSERIDGSLTLLSTAEAPASAEVAPLTLEAAWDAELASLPDDWSDLYAELELRSTDYLERAALLVAPVNPARDRGKTAFRFRCARNFGYGASAGMVRRSLARLDEEGIRGQIRILRALSDTRPVATQGPVWYVGGRSV